MGLHHGAYCLGCCWALMVLLFLLGVMNLLWIAVLAAFVLVGKGGSRRSLGEPYHRPRPVALGDGAYTL